ncbi:signal peptidase I [Compostimonas suwonensis]|uniref:Signal peptidase I n=1 Tax=Compostimonas suwonensis TaxID=1048394 RepID=A0A2M9BC60_9MICO|nr:signal peptidase I [Compostimonas suwonensis]PJJ55527.1 signal peptidase I [Compostimonas suwonensis]
MASLGVREVLLRVLALAVLAYLLAQGLRSFVVEVFVVTSGSMAPTMAVGDQVLVDKLRTVERGDIVVFRDPGGWIDPVEAVIGYPQDLPEEPAADDDGYVVKRVIGLPGDRVSCCSGGDGALLVNGAEVDEPYLYPGEPASSLGFDILVPEGSYWVMGDHRSASRDSRFHAADEGGGGVRKDMLVGVVTFGYGPAAGFSAH